MTDDGQTLQTRARQAGTAPACTRLDRPLVLIRGMMPAAAIEMLGAAFPTVRIAAQESPTALGDRRGAVRALATFGTIGASSNFIDALPSLEMISVFGVGVDGVDLEAARRRSIRVTNTPDVLTEDTADYAFGLVLALARRMIAGDRYVRSGRWGTEPFADGARVRGRKLGIVGMGRIGRALANRAIAFGMEVEWSGPREKPELPYRFHASPQSLARSCDVLVVTCPGGPTTAGLIDTDVIRTLTGKYLVNVSRGTVVDQHALVTALTSGRLAGAALDVFENEPRVPAELMVLENVILEPHIASSTIETRREIGQLMVRNLNDYFDGRSLAGRQVC